MQIRIITTFGKLSVEEVIEIAGRGSPGSLQRLPADSLHGTCLRSRRVVFCTDSSSFDPQGCLFLAEAFFGFRRHFTPFTTCVIAIGMLCPGSVLIRSNFIPRALP